MKKPYVFQEYPKWVKNLTGADVIVQNAGEEATACAAPNLDAEEYAIIEKLEAVRKKHEGK